jgi:hypothetical protein
MMLPAVVAAIGAVRRSHPILIAAGVLCLAQSFVAFSGLSLPFIVPAAVLLTLGARAGSTVGARRSLVGGGLVIAFGFAAWLVPFALTETSCWVARTGADGMVVYAPLPLPAGAVAGTGGGVNLVVDPTEIASGCDGGTFTVQGAALATVFWIGAVSIAALTSMPTFGVDTRREGFA